MLHARKQGAFKRAYDITSGDGTPIATWSPSSWQNKGEFVLDGVRYAVRTEGWIQQRAELVDGQGRELAAADQVGRKQWTIATGGRGYTFRRASVWRADQVLEVGGRQVGTIRRTGRWSTGAEADLPGLPPPVAVFTLVVVLMMWERTAAAAAAT